MLSQNRSGTTTKLRVVFNASAKTINSYSLNESIIINPELQEDLFDIYYISEACNSVYWRYRKNVSPDSGALTGQKILKDFVVRGRK